MTAEVGFTVAAAIFALGLAAVHLASGRLEFATKNRRRRFLSAGGGASVAYIFVITLPEVADAAAIIGEIRKEAFVSEQLVFLVVLLGFVLFYGIEVVVTQRLGEDAEDSKPVYWAHLLLFTGYSSLIGYLLFHQDIENLSNLFFYTLAMTLHFGITDYGFHRHYGHVFDTRGRRLLAIGTLVGAAVGFWTEIGAYPLAIVTSFVAGAVVFNVLKEELPDLDNSRFVAFLVGAGVFSVVTLLI